MSRLDEICERVDKQGFKAVDMQDVEDLIRIARAAEKMRDMIEAVRESGDCGDIPYGWCLVDKFDAAIKGESK